MNATPTNANEQTKENELLLQANIWMGDLQDRLCDQETSHPLGIDVPQTTAILGSLTILVADHDHVRQVAIEVAENLQDSGIRGILIGMAQQILAGTHTVQTTILLHLHDET